MKKFLLLVLSLSVLAVLSACSDSGSSSNNGGGATGGAVQVPIGDVKALEGTYDIEFFYSGVNAIIQQIAITTDCSKISTYVNNAQASCAGQNESVTHSGQGTIQVLEDGSVKVQTKLQMNGGIFDNPNNNKLLAGLMGLLTPNQYVFTDFKTIPASAIGENIINDPATNNNVKGTQGRNKSSIITYSNPNADKNDGAANTYEFTLLSDGTVINTMTDKSSLYPAQVIVRMKKVKNTVDPLNANAAYETPVISGFSSEVNYTEKKWL